MVWSKTAQKALEKHYNYIKEDSLKSAKKVKSEILKITKSLSIVPTRYPLDKYRKNNKAILESLRNIV